MLSGGISGDSRNSCIQICELYFYVCWYIFSAQDEAVWSKDHGTSSGRVIKFHDKLMEAQKLALQFLQANDATEIIKGHWAEFERLTQISNEAKEFIAKRKGKTEDFEAAIGMVTPLEAKPQISPAFVIRKY